MRMWCDFTLELCFIDYIIYVTTTVSVFLVEISQYTYEIGERRAVPGQIK